jgi:hypothetical protein
MLRAPETGTSLDTPPRQEVPGMGRSRAAPAPAPGRATQPNPLGAVEFFLARGMHYPGNG